MSSASPHIEPFRGRDWEECNDFIRAIRTNAWKEGKLRDVAWMADFASIHLSHKALCWHSQLPRDVRQDWDKLEVALINRWATPEDIDGSQIYPTPAAVPFQKAENKATAQLQGRLKVIVNGSNESFYVQDPHDGRWDLVSTATAAIRVRCNSLSGATFLERIDRSCHSWLAVMWPRPTPNLGGVSSEYGGLFSVDSDMMKPADSNEKAWQVVTCEVTENGQITLKWITDKGRRLGTTLALFVAGTSLYVTGDPTTFIRTYPSMQKLQLIIEKTD